MKSNSFLSIFFSFFFLFPNLHAEHFLNIITTKEYCYFLNNLVNSSVPVFYNEKMGSDPLTASIIKTEKIGSYNYEPIAGREDWPVPFVNRVSGVQFYNSLVGDNVLAEDLLNDGDLSLAVNGVTRFINESGSLQLTLDVDNESQKNQGSLIQRDTEDSAIVAAGSLFLAFMLRGNDQSEERSAGIPSATAGLRLPGIGTRSITTVTPFNSYESSVPFFSSAPSEDLLHDEKKVDVEEKGSPLTTLPTRDAFSYQNRLQEAKRHNWSEMTQYEKIVPMEEIAASSLLCRMDALGILQPLKEKAKKSSSFNQVLEPASSCYAINTISRLKRMIPECMRPAARVFFEEAENPLEDILWQQKAIKEQNRKAVREVKSELLKSIKNNRVIARAKQDSIEQQLAKWIEGGKRNNDLKRTLIVAIEELQQVYTNWISEVLVAQIDTEAAAMLESAINGKRLYTEREWNHPASARMITKYSHLDGIPLINEAHRVVAFDSSEADRSAASGFCYKRIERMTEAGLPIAEIKKIFARGAVSDVRSGGIKRTTKPALYVAEAEEIFADFLKQVQELYAPFEPSGSSVILDKPAVDDFLQHEVLKRENILKQVYRENAIFISLKNRWIKFLN